MLILLLVLIGFLFSIVSLKYFFLPYILIAICWLSLFIILTLTSKTTVKKAIWFNLAFTVLLLGALEAYSYFSLNTQENESSYRKEGGYTKGYFTPNEIFGYGPTLDKKITSKKFYKNQLVYDVTYTIGNDGRRITPTSKSHYDNECIIFFGGSFTFGEGVDDRESMPYIVGDLISYKVHNFGFHGYGPHQMLSAIENGLIDCTPKWAIYQVLSGHVARSAGYGSWDKHGPKYILRNGQLTRNGHFDDSINKGIFNQLEKSHFYRIFVKDRYTITDNDIKIFLEIVDTSRRKLVEKYPEIEFHVILWNKMPDDATYLKVRNGLKSLSIKFHLVSDMLPDFFEDIEKYEISTYDKHPNPIAHQMIAEYVVNNIMEIKNPHKSD